MNEFPEDQKSGPSKSEPSPTLEEDEEEFWEIPPPPDGGWGWVIVIASFICNVTVDGICYTFGVFLNHFLEEFQEPKAKIAWAGSILVGVTLGGGK